MKKTVILGTVLSTSLLLGACSNENVHLKNNELGKLNSSNNGQVDLIPDLSLGADENAEGPDLTGLALDLDYKPKYVDYMLPDYLAAENVKIKEGTKRILNEEERNHLKSIYEKGETGNLQEQLDTYFDQYFVSDHDFMVMSKAELVKENRLVEITAHTGNLKPAVSEIIEKINAFLIDPILISNQANRVHISIDDKVDITISSADIELDLSDLSFKLTDSAAKGLQEFIESKKLSELSGKELEGHLTYISSP